LISDSCRPGKVVLIGSGETSSSGGKVFDSLAQEIDHIPLRIAIMETPAGFELNSAQVAGRIASFLEVRLQNYSPSITVIPARKRGTVFSPDNLDILQSLISADIIFLGPGSPTYTIRQLKDSLAWQIIQACHRQGAILVLASAAVIAFGAKALPIYEIYKVGQDIHWVNGLNFWRPYGLPLTLIPHWNNTDGGIELDTSHCFMGVERFNQLLELLDRDQVIIGIDERTSFVMDFTNKTFSIEGDGVSTIIRSGIENQYHPGEIYPLELLGNFQIADLKNGIASSIWEQVTQKRSEMTEAGVIDIPEQVKELVGLRQIARNDKDWALSDKLRDQITALGWQVNDTPEGPQIEKRANSKRY